MRGEGERNYHLFYYMLGGCSGDERAEYKLLGGPAEYSYLAGETGRELLALDPGTPGVCSPPLLSA